MSSIDLALWSYNNWMKVPEEQRKLCIDHLRGWITIEQLREAMKSPMFHMFGGGMQIRNRLRDVIKDDQLPAVMYEDYQAHNWDDYYLGALTEFMSPQIELDPK